MSQLARQDAAGGAESGSSISEDVGDNVGSNELEEKFQAVLNEKDGLLAEINLLKIARDDAEKNADIFRDLYNAASSFASELKSENVDLKSHLSLSEGQLKSGLPLIKSQYGVQLAKLKEELEQSQALVKLFSEKDRRTDDEVRQRAAKVPDYLALIDELRSEKQELKTERDTVLRQRNELLVENKDLGSQLSDERGRCEHMRDENLRLRVELARFGARERSVRKMMIHLNSPANYDSDAEGEPEDPGQEEFYVCHWARNEDPTARCGQHFTSKQVGFSAFIYRLPRVLCGSLHTVFHLPYRTCKTISSLLGTYNGTCVLIFSLLHSFSVLSSVMISVMILAFLFCGSHMYVSHHISFPARQQPIAGSQKATNLPFLSLPSPVLPYTVYICASPFIPINLMPCR